MAHETSNLSNSSVLLGRNKRKRIGQQNLQSAASTAKVGESRYRDGKWYMCLSTIAMMSDLLEKSEHDSQGFKKLLRTYFKTQEEFKQAANNWLQGKTVSEVVSTVNITSSGLDMSVIWSRIITEGIKFSSQPAIQARIKEHVNFLKLQLSDCEQHEVEALSHELIKWKRQILGKGLKSLLSDA